MRGFAGAELDDLALLVDLYELIMVQAYWTEGMEAEAVFSLFVRRLPARRNYLLAAGLGDALDYLAKLRFSPGAIDYLRSLGHFQPGFLDWLRAFRFEGEIWALPEGTPFFAHEPILEVTASLSQAQLVETLLINQIQLQTLIASKASRVVQAAAGRPVIDFGLRRAHGFDAGLKSARASYLAGMTSTSAVLAGKIYGLPLAGTMAHSYIQAHDSERDAFRAFADLYPETILLVDTYDTREAIARVIELAEERGDRFGVQAVRLDSGDLHELSRSARNMLDAAGLERVGIVASGGLAEDQIAALVGGGAPIDVFGVGTDVGVSADAPALDIVYKLVAYAGEGRIKRSPGKELLPGPKQVFRVEERACAVRDLIGRRGEEEHSGRPLLERVMVNGRPIAPEAVALEAARARAREQVAQLPSRVRALEPAVPPYPVELSESLRESHATLVRRFSANAHAPRYED